MACLLHRASRIGCLLAALLIVSPSAAQGAGARRGQGHRAEARVFAMRIVRLVGENRYAEAWSSLHPLHQEAAPLDRYVRCENLTPILLPITSVRTLRVWDAPIYVAGISDRVLGTKVKLRIGLGDATTSAGVTFVKIVNLVRVAHRWVWLLPAARYEAYVAGDCPQ